VARHSELEQSFLEIFIEQHTQLRRARTFATHPREIAFHLDATDGPVQGHQRGRFFQGYYRTYCFRPLDIFCGQDPLCAMLRPADSDARAGSLLRVKRRVTRLRQAWPDVVITLRPDSGFCRDNLRRGVGAKTIRSDICLDSQKKQAFHHGHRPRTARGETGIREVEPSVSRVCGFHLSNIETLVSRAASGR
ncbi:MAG: transposase, partial [Planctomycetales bacterium]|nr:transposase [Planctomycetales bacterium]